jgi:transcriptional regulator GlxA family with amidase domain
VDSRVQTVIELIQRDLRRPVDWCALGNAVAISPSRLRQLFKESTGLSPLAFLKRLRFERARELLAMPALASLRVKEVMAQVGVSDPSHFVREFKELCGETPMTYRRQHLQAARAGESANRLAKSPTESTPKRHAGGI